MTERTLPLPGCSPQPLLSYLKALGVLRLLAEQNGAVRGHWSMGYFVLSGEMDEKSLVSFFLNDYRPTPIVVPWSGNDFFEVSQKQVVGPRKKTPKGPHIVEAFLQTNSPRLALYRRVIHDCLVALQQCGIRSKEQMEKPAKAGYLSYLRAVLPDEAVEWVDAAAIVASGKTGFSVLLGSGGGSDGNSNFSDNFMQNLWEVLPDFDSQKVVATKCDGRLHSEALLRGALFGSPVRDLAAKRTSSLFDSGAVGGPNATQGLEREAIANPWNFILALEGTICLAGATAKRFGRSTTGTPSFPFQFRLTPTGQTSLADKEATGREVWLPLWGNAVQYSEIRQVLAEGRAELNSKPVNRGVDMMRAVAMLGVDRGIESFWRYAVVKGRVGGENYNTAVSLGELQVQSVGDVDLLREIDPWLNRFRAACGNDAPPQIRAILRRIENAIFDFSHYGGFRRFAEILCSLGGTERQLAAAERWRADRKLSPIPLLSSKWIAAGRDGTVEFDIALAIAGIHEPQSKIGAIRTNLEAVALHHSNRGRDYAWTEKDRSVTWNSSNLSVNLVSILNRRIMDGNRAGASHLALSFVQCATLDEVATFLSGAVDDERIAELLWGLVLIDQQPAQSARRNLPARENPILSRYYALLKLVFLPGGLLVSQSKRVRFAREGEKSIRITPELRLLSLVRSGNISRACSIAVQRLRASGLSPLDIQWDEPSGLDGLRLAAALLIPISEFEIWKLLHLTTTSLRSNQEIGA